MYEHHKQPLATRKTFARRLMNNAVIALVGIDHVA